jgi:hypothetical protein
MVEVSDKRANMMEETKHARKRTVPVLPPPPEPPYLLIQLAKNPLPTLHRFSSMLQRSHKMESQYEQQLRTLGRDYLVIPPPPVFDKDFAVESAENSM